MFQKKHQNGSKTAKNDFFKKSPCMILSGHWDSIQSKFQVYRPKDVGKNSGQTNKQNPDTHSKL